MQFDYMDSVHAPLRRAFSSQLVKSYPNILPAALARLPRPSSCVEFCHPECFWTNAAVSKKRALLCVSGIVYILRQDTSFQIDHDDLKSRLVSGIAKI